MNRLEDIDYGDDLSLMSQTLEDMSENLEDFRNYGTTVGHKIKLGKSIQMRIITRNNQQLMVNNKLIEEVNQFQYLGSIVSYTGTKFKNNNIL